MRKTSRSLAALIIGAALASPVVQSAHAVACPAWGAVQTGAAIAEPSINEASGLVMSGDHPGVLWMIEDSLNPPILWAINTQGQTVGQFTLSGAINVDWEDISIDRLPGTDQVYVPTSATTRTIATGRCGRCRRSIGFPSPWSRLRVRR